MNDPDLDDGPVVRPGLGTILPKTGTPVGVFLGTEHPNYQEYNQRVLESFRQKPQTSIQSGQCDQDPDGIPLCQTPTYLRV